MEFFVCTKLLCDTFDFLNLFYMKKIKYLFLSMVNLDSFQVKLGIVSMQGNICKLFFLRRSYICRKRFENGTRLTPYILLEAARMNVLDEVNDLVCHSF